MRIAGDTHARGSGNYAAIVSKLVAPALGGAAVPAEAAGRLRAARAAALADPEGRSLALALNTGLPQ